MRFRLKTEFLTYAHGQIRGGLWYKPTWWEAVQRVPPCAVLPRPRKASIPRLRFVEDALMRDFAARNPALRDVDARNFARGRTSSVAAEFVSAQLRAMRGGASASAAYDTASRWLVDNGPAVLSRVDARLLGGGGVPPAAVPPADLFERAMGMQGELLREALSTEAAARAGTSVRALPPHRTFLSAEETEAIAARTAHRAAPRLGAVGILHADARAGAAAAADSSREAESAAVAAAVDETANADAAAAGGAPAVADGSPPRRRHKGEGSR